MRLLLVISAIMVLIIAGGYWLYQDPRVKELFESPAQTQPGKANSRSLPIPRTRSAEPQKPKPVPRRSAKEREQAEESEIALNQTPNDVLSRVLLQILAAKKLSGGISIEVSDQKIRVLGTAASSEDRQRIISTLEKGREARKVDAADLLVQE